MGTMPVTPTAEIALASILAARSRSGTSARTLDHQSSVSSSAQLAWRETSALGRDAVARMPPSVSIRMPIVDVVPISRPSKVLTSREPARRPP